MKKKYNKEMIVNLLTSLVSLDTVIDVLNNVCENVNVNNRNAKSKNFKNLKFNFYILLMRLKSLLEITLFRVEPLKDDEEFWQLRDKLKSISIYAEKASKLLQLGQLENTTQKLTMINNEYKETYEKTREKITRILT